MTRQTLLVLALLSLAGCDRRAKDAFLRGEESLKGGDVRGAAVEFRSACRLDPENEDFCRRADETGAKVRADAIPRAMAACDQGDGLRCIEELRLVDEVMPGPEVTQLLDRGAALFVKRCEVKVSTLADAMFRVRCVESIHDRVRSPGYEAVVRAARSEARELARSLSAQQESPGVAYGYAAVGLCFQRDPLLQVEANRLEAAFRAQMQWRPRIDSNFFDSRVLCDRVARSDSRVACRGPDNVQARFEVDSAPVRHAFSDEQLSKEYVAAVVEVENPAWREAQVKVAYLQGVSEEADAGLRRAEKECGGVEKCRHKAREHAKARREELEAARRALEGIQRVLRQEQRSVYRWTRRTHTWSLAFSVSMGAGTLTDRLRDTVSWSSEEQAPFEPAGVEGLTARSPSERELNEAIWARSSPRFVELVQASLAAWGRERRQACPSVDLARADQVQCGAEAAFLTGESVRGLLVSELARQLDARRDLPQYGALACD